MFQFIVDFFNATYRERYGSDVSEESLTMLWSLTTALFIPGGIIGSLLGGWLADAIGRYIGLPLAYFLNRPTFCHKLSN